MKEIAYFQRGFNYSQDGPGNRLVYHLCGCNLQCPWCSNPEGMQLKPDRKVYRDSTAALAEAVVSARPMFFDGGGLTLTGGECTLQFEAVCDLLQRVHQYGISTCIETNATHPRLSELLDVVDVVIADLKHPDPEQHKRWTGMDNQMILSNLCMLASSSLPLQLRVPLIHGVNDDDKALEGFVSFFASMNRSGMTVEFLPYHEYGKDKWIQSGLPYQMQDAFISPQQLELFRSACRRAGICVIQT